MNVDAMRRVDRHVGVPLCAIATVLVKMLSFLFKRARPMRRVLFIELSEMGTTVLAQPAMRRARDKLQAELYFVIFARNVGSLDLTGEISPANVFTIRDTSLLHLAWDTLTFLCWTRRKAIDTVIDLELFSRFTALLAGLSSAERRVGFYRFHNEGLYRGEMLTHRVAYNPHIHIAKNLIALVEALALPPQVPYTKIRIDDGLKVSIPPASQEARMTMLASIRAEAAFDTARQRLVLVNPNASEMLPHRRWMGDRYAELIRRVIASRDDVLVGITGAPSEREEAEALAKAAGTRCISLAGKTKLADLPALYSLAVVMISNDSGPSHFAAASGLRTIVLFGPETPQLYQPLGPSRAIYAGLACSPCVSAHNHRKTACTDNVCMKAIGVEEVYAAVCEELEKVT